MIEKFLVFFLCFFSMNAIAFAANEKTLIAKCTFEVGHEVRVGSPYLYVFGKRKIVGDQVVVENFEVQHELALFEDDIRSNLLPNLDPSRVFPAEFGDNIFGVRWTHPPIDGRTESTVSAIFAYEDKDTRVTSTTVTRSALAISNGFEGAYAICRNLGMR